ADADVPATDTGTPTDQSTTPATPTTPTAPPAATQSEDIFDVGQLRHVLDEPGGLASDRPRIWSDARGRPSCSARLAAVSPEGVVLARDESVEVRVAFRALSDIDLLFVRRQIRARQRQLAAAGVAFASTPAP